MDKKVFYNILISRSLAFFLFMNFLLSPLIMQLIFSVLMGKDWIGFVSNPVVIFRLVSTVLVITALVLILFLKKLGKGLLVLYLSLDFSYSIYFVLTNKADMSSLKAVCWLVGGFLMSNLFLLILLFNVFDKDMQKVFNSKNYQSEFTSAIKGTIFSNELIKWMVLVALILYFLSRILMFWGNIQ